MFYRSRYYPNSPILFNRRGAPPVPAVPNARAIFVTCVRGTMGRLFLVRLLRYGTRYGTRDVLLTVDVLETLYIYRVFGVYLLEHL